MPSDTKALNRLEGGKRLSGIVKRSQSDLPLISVITIVYNNASCIEKTIKSVVDQRYENVEYIVIDGGSTDGTLEILKKYDGIIDYWLSEKDQGISDAFNKGTRVSSGGYLNYLNSGDTFVDITVLERVIENSDSTRNEIISSFSQFNKNTIPKKSLSNESSLLKKSLISHQASFVTAGLIKDVEGYNSDYRIRMDYDIWLKILPKCQLTFVDDIWVNYADGGISGEYLFMGLREEIKAQLENLSGKELVVFMLKSICIRLPRIAQIKLLSSLVKKKS